MKSVVVDTNAHDWEGDEPLRRPSSRTVMYEMHVDSRWHYNNADPLTWGHITKHRLPRREWAGRNPVPAVKGDSSPSAIM